MGKLGEFWSTYIVQPFTTFRWTDFIDILLLAAIFYGVYSFVRLRRAGKLVFGLAMVLVLYAVADLLSLRATTRLLGGVASVGIIIIAIIFQPELRDALEKLSNTVFDLRAKTSQRHASLAQTVSEVVEAACQIAQREEDGALIVIERSTKLGDYVNSGIRLDAEVNSHLLRNIFFNRSPMHDGAVFICNDRVAAAGCKLPLTFNEEVARGLGTRHRAAIGITEVSDCVVVVVSEEKHIISVANHGLLKRDYNRGMADLKNEESLKTVQNKLRQDLFLLLAGTPLDEEPTEKGKDTKKARDGKKTDRQTVPSRSSGNEAKSAQSGDNAGRRRYRLGVLPGRKHPTAEKAPGTASAVPETPAVSASESVAERQVNRENAPEKSPAPVSEAGGTAESDRIAGEEETSHGAV